jgi:1-acyl-sn-glycerol-3-phosphate acyltransferase
MYQARVSKPFAALYFFWQWLVFAPFVAVSLVLVLIPILVARLFRSENAAYTCGRIWAWLQCLCNFTRIRRHSVENLTPGQGYVIMTNHQSNFDFCLIAAIPCQLRFLMKEELKHVPIFGWACTGAGTVWIDRHDREKAIRQLESAKPKFKRGVSLQVHPEGTRSFDGRIGPFKKGGFMVALQLGAPILPVTIRGSGDIWPPGSMRILPGTIDYIFHPPIDVSEYGPERVDELMQAVRDALNSGLSDDAV